MGRQVLNPATGEVVANVPCMGQSETNYAISSAYDAFRCKKLHTEPTVQFSKMYYCIYAIHINKLINYPSPTGAIIPYVLNFVRGIWFILHAWIIFQYW